MTLVLPGLYVRKNIKEDGIEETVRNARREAVLIRMQMETAPDGVHGLSSTFDRIGTELGIRITFIGADGTVLAESDSSRINLNDLDNHADRQEIGAAIREGFGVSIRHSNTLDTDLVYAAIPFAAVGKLPDGFIRVAVPLKHVEERIAQSERQWLAIVGLATLIALLFAYGLSTHLERSLKEMIRVVESIATDPAGQGNRRRLHILPGREFRRLAHAVNDMADRTEEHLRTIAENKAQLKTILDVMNEGVLVIGEKGRIRLVQPRPRAPHCSPQAKDAEGKFPVEVIPAAEIQQALDELLSAPQDKPRLITLEVEPRPDMILSVQFIRPREAIHDVLAVAVFHDISEMARLMRVRKEFIANVSHELRTPLTAIWLRRNPPGFRCRRSFHLRQVCGNHPPQRPAYGDDGGRSAQALAHRERRGAYGNGNREGGKHPFRRDHGLPAANRHTQPDAGNRHRSRPYRTGRSPLHRAGFPQPHRKCLPLRSRRLHHQGFRRKRLDHNGLPEALFMICDDGPGIPQADIARVFERFYRVEKHRSSPASTGLGLAICKHIVERHGRRIWAELGFRGCNSASPRCGNGKRRKGHFFKRGPYHPQCPPDSPAPKNSRKDAHKPSGLRWDSDLFD